MGQDERLVMGLRAADAGAFNEAYERYGDRLYSFALRLTGRRDAADELFQHAWVTLAERAPRLRADTCLMAWLLTVARNHWRSQHRKAKTHDRHEDALRHAAPSVAGPERSVERAAMLARLEAALLALAEHHREVLVLMIESDDVPQQELAAVLDVAPAVFRKRLSRARAALAALLQPEEERDDG